MAIDAYLKTAAAHLRRAADERKHETNQVKSTIHDKEMMTTRHKNDLQREIRFKQDEIKHSNDSQEQATRTRELLLLQKELTLADQQLNQQKQEHLQAIDAKEQDAQDLVRKAGELESRAAAG